MYCLFFSCVTFEQNRAYTTSQISDLTEKLNRAEGSLSQRAPLSALAPELAQGKTQSNVQPAPTNPTGKGKEAADTGRADVPPPIEAESALSKVVKDASKINAECQHGMMYVASSLYNCLPRANPLILASFSGHKSSKTYCSTSLLSQ